MDKHAKCSVSGNEREQKLVCKTQVEQLTRGMKQNIIRTLPETRNYLNEKKILDIFHFLLGHLVIHQPTDPIQYLYDLLDDCILYRSGFKEPRLLWTKKHIDAVFRKVNNSTLELLPLDRYKTAMKILGISSYNASPVERKPGYVDRETFRTEALNSLKQEFTCIMGTPIPPTSLGCACNMSREKDNLEQSNRKISQK